MTLLDQLLLWLLVSAIPQTRPTSMSADVSAPDLADAPLVPVQKIESPDSVQILRDGGVVGVRLAGVACPQQNAAARDAAADVLRRMLVGEKVWLVPAGPPDKSDKWYLYRWPDKLFVNLELVRQGYADAATEPEAPAAIGQAFVHCRDLARQKQKGIWGQGPAAAARTPASQPVTSASPVGQAAASASPAGRPSAPDGQAAASASPAGRPSAPDGQAAASASPAGRPSAPDGRAVIPRSAVAPAPEQVDASDRSVVYVTAHGKKYHRASCRSLRSGGKAITLSEARKTYEPCRQCNPPQ